MLRFGDTIEERNVTLKILLLVGLVAQLVEQSLPTPEIRGSNLDMVKILFNIGSFK